MRFPRLDKKID